MAETNLITEKLIAEFTQSHMEKLFYFCLKKTGNHAEAEDLTQDIALNVLTELNKGTIPAHFSAWVWRIARNRYAAWADGKHRKAESVTGADIGDYELEDTSESTLDQMIHREQLALLRRELAFIGSEYRHIVVAHYIEDRSIREIAASLFLSVGAVKQRLYRARNILKEGMNMAREFGTRSYKPEDISYSMGLLRLGSKHQPKCIMEHALYENIFLEAYGNPSSAEALSLELGVALPYMESELEYLTRETFLTKKDGKYQTAFPIVSRTAQEQVHAAQLAAAPGITKALATFIDRLTAALGEGYYGTDQDAESAKWTLLLLAHQHFEVKSPHTHQFTQRPDDGQWDIVGYQRCTVPKPAFVGNHVLHGNGYMLQQFSAVPGRDLTAEDAQVIFDAVIGRISDKDAPRAAELAECGYLRRTGDTYVPAIPVMKPAAIRHTVNSMDAETRSVLNALADSAKQQMAELHHMITEIVRSDLPAIFAGNAFQCELAASSCDFSRGYIMAEALRQGYLLPAEKVSRAVGAYLDLV